MNLPLGYMVVKAVDDVILAADPSGSGSTDFISILTGLGPVGVILLLFIFGKLRTEAEVKRWQDIAKEKDAIIKSKDESIVQLYTSVINLSEVVQKNSEVLDQLRRSSGGS